MSSYYGFDGSTDLPPWPDADDGAVTAEDVAEEIQREQDTPALAIHHLDGDPYNNDLSNLIIVDLRENREEEQL